MGVIRKCQVFFQFLCNFFSGILGVYAKSVAFAIAWFTRLPEFSRKLLLSNLENSMKKKAKSGAEGAQMTSKSLKLLKRAQENKPTDGRFFR
jgi:hypothetical protein